jgi:hypothetical protein
MWHACICGDIPKYFWWKPEGKRELEKATLKWKVVVKMDLKEAAWVSEEG